MDWVKHSLIGFVIALTAFYAMGLDPYEIAVLSAFAAGSALLPDLDHAGSKAREVLDKLIIFVAVIFTSLSYCHDLSCVFTENFVLRVFAFAGVYFIIFAYFRPEHRGITHSLLLAAFFSLLVYFMSGYRYTFALAGLIGYLSHLLADREIKLI